ncbi:MAG: folylpolyglutamate synthase/dihydrofolate synthase family protein [Coleofasciculus chthonoplastes F3-SA18-01]|uniref:bifunctional folylpolyglutamate synthase/dihydrofolate synthase n=1 Tax=Coleofasciculus chthonoplastes TaxID=64178 RepID=UPI0033006B87
MDINSLLQPYQRFGVHLGLERIQRLLEALGNPHQCVPMIHVAGTNGKGSVCAYLSSVLSEAGYRVGRYTSPHLIDWTERICINQHPISTTELVNVLEQVQAAISPDTEESPTQFEVITAAAWLYFAQEQVDVAVIEVGLGGRLDATNVCDQPLATIITSISREHWQVLGSTLSQIATEKAGILKPNCPAIIAHLPPEANVVVQSRIEALNCPVTWVESAKEFNRQNVVRAGFEQRLSSIATPKSLNPPLQTQNYDSPLWASYEGIIYPLPLLGEIQLTNSAVAIATLQSLVNQGWHIPDSAIVSGMAKTQWLGRLQWTQWKNYRLLVDGAHNPAAAIALREYVDRLNRPVTWVMGILSTKEHESILRALLRSCDRVYLVPVPDHSSAEPEELSAIARSVCPTLTDCHTYPNLEAGLQAATATADDSTIVLCGSLYLVGYFLGS